MADAAVERLLDNLKQLLLHHGHLIKNVRNQVEMLENDLNVFKAILRDSTKKMRTDKTLRELVRQIHDVVYEAEDMIDAFVTQATEIQSKNRFLRKLKQPIGLDFRSNLESLALRVKAIYEDTMSFDRAILNIGDHDEGTEEDEAAKFFQQQAVEEQCVVGFEDEGKKIIGYLTEETVELDVISIIGMPGLGKTTLARKIFHDPAIQYAFPTRIWVYVSLEFRNYDVYRAILEKFTRITHDDMYKKSEEELVMIVSHYLERGKCLIVFDDVWIPEHWDMIRVALPRSNNAIKVIITSRNESVGRHANRRRPPHHLRFLTEEESWSLLQLRVFGKPDCPPELEALGRVIAVQCGGLPLTIVAIGGILAPKLSNFEGLSGTMNAWRQVLNNIETYLTEDPGKCMERIISLSYDKLPYHLRPCFLYLGMFPQGFEISVWKLVRMWIAEGFIKRRDDITLEATAEIYLDELISWNLVIVDKRRHDGRAKTCRIHGILRDFCKHEAGRENFFHEIHSTSEVEQVYKYRRICIHSDVLRFISSKPRGPRVRSFACFSKEEDIVLPGDQHMSTSAIPDAFKLLRVLDVKPVKFTKNIPRGMYHLIHLRYIVLSVDAAQLPKDFAKLWNMQTLIVDTTSPTLEIRADIWKLNQLRHIKTNVSTTFPKPGKSSEGGKNLQSLGTISPESCTEEVIDRARNLKKLGIRGKLALLLEGRNNNVSFDYLGKLDSLEKLKLLNDVFPDAPSDDRLLRLPPTYNFPPNLRSLTLSATFLDWNRDMPTLGLLDNLEVLKLKDRAFMGGTWEVTTLGFRSLKALHIGRTDLTYWLAASSHHFPSLRRLELHYCEELQEIPFGLADVPTFQVLDLFHSKHAAESAKKIGDAKQKIKDGEFKLSIFHPEA